MNQKKLRIGSAQSEVGFQKPPSLSENHERNPLPPQATSQGLPQPPLEPAQAMESWLVTPWVAFKMGACRLAWAEDAKDPGPKGDRATLWPKSGCRRVEAAPNKFGVVARAAFDVPKPDSAPE